ncbi:MAG TPA: M20 family peptidase [Longimicrobiales bacterium]|nr:M20 family peptidase [Longimicrobiales bacterium]
MRRPLLLAGGLLLAAVVVLAALVPARSARLASRQPEVPPAPRRAVDPGAIERLAGALRFRTISYQDSARFPVAEFAGLESYLRGAFPHVHAALAREAVGERGVLYTWPGADATRPPIVLMAHMDVVPVEPGTEARWQQPPFGGTVSGGYVWGRGALDDKVNVLAELEAVEGLLRAGFRPSRTVYLSFGKDEEVGGTGARAVAGELRRRGVRPAFILDEGGAIFPAAVPGLAAPAALVGIAEKGSVSVELAVPSAGGHSSMPPRETPVGILARALVRLQDHPMPARLDGPARAMFEYVAPELGGVARATFANLWLTKGLVEGRLAASPATDAMIRTTTAPTMLAGSPKENVLPARPTAVVNFRIRPGDTVDGVLAHVREVVADPRVRIAPLHNFTSNPSHVSDPAAPEFRLLQRSIREVFPGTVVAPYLVVGGTDSRHFEGLTANIYRFMPIRVAPSDLERLHGTDERVPVDSYLDAVRFYDRLLRAAAGVPTR